MKITTPSVEFTAAARAAGVEYVRRAYVRNVVSRNDAHGSITGWTDITDYVRNGLKAFSSRVEYEVGEFTTDSIRIEVRGVAFWRALFGGGLVEFLVVDVIAELTAEPVIVFAGWAGESGVDYDSGPDSVNFEVVGYDGVLTLLSADRALVRPLRDEIVFISGYATVLGLVPGVYVTNAGAVALAQQYNCKRGRHTLRYRHSTADGKAYFSLDGGAEIGVTPIGIQGGTITGALAVTNEEELGGTYDRLVYVNMDTELIVHDVTFEQTFVFLDTADLWPYTWPCWADLHGVLRNLTEPAVVAEGYVFDRFEIPTWDGRRTPSSLGTPPGGDFFARPRCVDFDNDGQGGLLWLGIGNRLYTRPVTDTGVSPANPYSFVGETADDEYSIVRVWADRTNDRVVGVARKPLPDSLDPPPNNHAQWLVFRYTISTQTFEEWPLSQRGEVAGYPARPEYEAQNFAYASALPGSSGAGGVAYAQTGGPASNQRVYAFNFDTEVEDEIADFLTNGLYHTFCLWSDNADVFVQAISTVGVDFVDVWRVYDSGGWTKTKIAEGLDRLFIDGAYSSAAGAFVGAVTEAPVSDPPVVPIDGTRTMTDAGAVNGFSATTLGHGYAVDRADGSVRFRKANTGVSRVYGPAQLDSIPGEFELVEHDADPGPGMTCWDHVSERMFVVTRAFMLLMRFDTRAALFVYGEANFDRQTAWDAVAELCEAFLLAPRISPTKTAYVVLRSSSGGLPGGNGSEPIELDDDNCGELGEGDVIERSVYDVVRVTGADGEQGSYDGEETGVEAVLDETEYGVSNDFIPPWFVTDMAYWFWQHMGATARRVYTVRHLPYACHREPLDPATLNFGGRVSAQLSGVVVAHRIDGVRSEMEVLV